jgi:hypothetical protein
MLLARASGRAPFCAAPRRFLLQLEPRAPLLVCSLNRLRDRARWPLDAPRECSAPARPTAQAQSDSRLLASYNANTSASCAACLANRAWGRLPARGPCQSLGSCDSDSDGTGRGTRPQPVVSFKLPAGRASWRRGHSGSNAHPGYSPKSRCPQAAGAPPSQRAHALVP